MARQFPRSALCLEGGTFPTRPTSHANVPSQLVTPVTPMSEGRKVSDGVLETLMITSWVTSETGRFGADTFLNIAQGKG